MAEPNEPKYATKPFAMTTMPPGIPYIVGNEAAERFSFYGMKAILAIYMTQYLLMSDAHAKEYVHLFVASAYFFPLFGAIVSDWLLGKYPIILSLSVVYCLGHLALAVIPKELGLFLGLALIAVGAGGIKPCVSAHVGDQFGSLNKHLLNKVFSWFYFSINLGAFASTLLTPLLLDRVGPHVAFGVPGALMFLATFVFWLGRNKFVHVPPGGYEFIRESFSGEGLAAIRKLVPIYLFVAVFWSLYDQTASAWVLQAEHMDRTWQVADWLPFLQMRAWLPQRLQSIEWLSSQIQAVNPILILVFIPIFSYAIYPAIDKIFPLTPLRKVSLGFFVTVAAFAVSAWIELQITAGRAPDIGWQILAYIILTAAEVMVSITCLEFSYTQAPNRMKSLIMSIYLLSVSLGNLFTFGVNAFIQNPDGTSKLPGASYYWFFTGVMLAAAVGFVFVAMVYREKTYIQDEETPVEDDAERPVPQEVG